MLLFANLFLLYFKFSLSLSLSLSLSVFASLFNSLTHSPLSRCHSCNLVRGSLWFWVPVVDHSGCYQHIEIIVRQITSKVFVSKEGISNVFSPGELIELLRVEWTGHALEEAICYQAILLGIMKASLNTQSFTTVGGGFRFQLILWWVSVVAATMVCCWVLWLFVVVGEMGLRWGFFFLMKIFGYELWWWLVAMDSCRCMFYTILMGVYVILMSDVLKVINLM